MSWHDAYELVRRIVPLPKEEAAGGYEYEFTGLIPEKYKCMICHKVQCEATIISCCCKHFCKSCIDTWFQFQGRSCPHCRSTIFNYFINRERVQDINELMLKCTNVNVGCFWEGKLEDLRKHVDLSCGYTSVECPNKCHETVQRRLLPNHKKKECLLRPYGCQYCGLKDTYHAITGECGKYSHCGLHKGHYKTCGGYPVMCPNKCQEMTIKRKFLSKHIEICPLQPVDCPFKEVGCTTLVVRKDLQSHIDGRDHEHLMLMMRAFKEIKKENTQLKEENTQLRNSIGEVNSKISTLQAGISRCSSPQFLLQQISTAQIQPQNMVPVSHYVPRATYAMPYTLDERKEALSHDHLTVEPRPVCCFETNIDIPGIIKCSPHF